MKIKKLLIVVFICIFIPSINFAQQIMFSVDGGFSMLSGEGSEYWKSGFSIGGNILFPISKHILLGGASWLF